MPLVRIIITILILLKIFKLCGLYHTSIVMSICSLLILIELFFSFLNSEIIFLKSFPKSTNAIKFGIIIKPTEISAIDQIAFIGSIIANITGTK